MKEILQNYIWYIKEFEKIMKDEYNLIISPYLERRKFKRTGVIGKYFYSYHGAGCRLEYEDIVCEYDIAPLNGKEIKFTSEKFKEFLQTHPMYRNLNYDIKYIEQELFSLMKQNLLSYMVLDGIVYPVYQVEEDKI